MTRPTIIDVAKAAGVSKSTVSLVLQNSPSVSAKTREDVRKAMQELGYVYNRAAANLRSSQVGLVGLVINDLKNPFFAEFATAVQMAISDAGYATVVANTDENPALQARTIAAMIEHGVSGLIISPAYGDEEATFGQLTRAGVPALQVLRKVSPRTDLFPFAAPDYAAGGRLAAQHLIATGARRIAFVGGIEDRSVTAERLSGYLQVLAEHGQQPKILHGRPTRAFGRECADRLISDPDCDAAVCFNDLVALGVISGFASRGHLVGRDFRLVGFDDIEEAAQSYPPLSSVHCGISGFGQQMAATLMSWLNEGARPVAETRTPVDLVIRASSLVG
ncbi:LacI family DNA-binding transcriptional regulator [Fuscovulum ytuae]|uniref:LacI family DNA-binding transcriptional regulator n=1 Tax=Fuscovulum ytuae TaxID=3042299 RepID=A0ABY8Q566_9RHOB|nr:LacI family DNA-binding transcriptional regulator [Fuscovulum sp. YMD61]WGV15317.1 LacI family DNA-binding transcriptional regulator [Fuscovulum sp. YMD61]